MLVLIMLQIHLFLAMFNHHIQMGLQRRLAVLQQLRVGPHARRGHRGRRRAELCHPVLLVQLLISVL